MLDEIPLPEQCVYEGTEGHALRRVIGRGWIIGIPAMLAVSMFVLYVATNSVVWTLLVASWGAIVTLLSHSRTTSVRISAVRSPRVAGGLLPTQGGDTAATWPARPCLKAARLRRSAVRARSAV